jgi:hypothetical protein
MIYRSINKLQEIMCFPYFEVYIFYHSPLIKNILHIESYFFQILSLSDKITYHSVTPDNDHTGTQGAITSLFSESNPK